MKRLLLILFFVLGVSSLRAQYEVQPRMRVIIDNDFGGDPDGLFQLAHHLLSPSVEVRGIIGSHLTAQAGFDNSGNSAEKACLKARELMQLMGVGEDIPVVAGAAEGLTDVQMPQESAGAQLIIDEAMRDDSRPLYVVCGAGLTNIASAWLMNPAIARRLTLIWIGGQEYDGLALPPPGGSACEYNLSLSIKAAQVVFNRSDLSLWQVPRNAYRQCICSMAELQQALNGSGVGRYLLHSLTTLMAEMKQWQVYMGEVYVLGDSPLVLLTALQTGWEADAASSDYVLRQAPTVLDDGTYQPRADGRSIRVYTRIDTRLMFADMMAKLKTLE
ncbi:MAG: nucleoside hydrolase [Prevotella sp.]|nr:nucleoside hydrolase [Prevotella sp.]